MTNEQGTKPVEADPSNSKAGSLLAARAALSKTGLGDDGPLALLAKDVKRRFGETIALDGVDLVVRKKQIVGLVGPDGAGKTTLMRLFAGMMAPSSGMVQILGENPFGHAPKLRTRFGYLPQQYCLYGDLSVEENLSFFARLFNLKLNEYQQRRQMLLQITRLERFTDRRAEALSGGMYKKLALACALLPRPEVLLLDEPTNGVDPVSRRELWELLFDLVEEGMTIVISTPYMDEAERCHEVCLMHHGRIIASGTPNELIKRFAHKVIEIEASPENMQQCEEALLKNKAVMTYSVAGFHYRFIFRGTDDLLEKCRQENSSLFRSWRQVPPDFEDLFLTVTAEEEHA